MEKKFLYLRLKLLLWVLVGTLVAWLVGIFVMEVLLGGVLRSPVAKAFLWAAQNWHGMSYSDAVEAYQTYIAANRPIILSFLLGVLMLIACYIAFGRFSDYLNQVTGAIHQIFSGQTEPVTLPEELFPIQADLNGIQRALVDRQTGFDTDAQRKSDLIAYLAHDLKTPLTSVLGYLELLEAQPELPVEQRVKYTGIALEKAQRLEKLIAEFFDITQMELNVPGEGKVETRLDLLLYQLVEEFYPLFAEKELSCNTRLSGKLTVLANPERLARAFDNVLRNAVSYSNPNTAVEITASADRSGRVEVSISNEGLEIPEEELSTIFEKFYRLDEARQTRTGGMGLGLAIAKEIIEYHGGTIRASTTGKRTVFTIALPGV